MNLLLTGTGILGQAILESAVSDKKYNLITISKSSFNSKNHKIIDITDRNKTEGLFRDNDFDAVIHTAAFANVDGCERDKAKAFDINSNGTRYIADECEKRSIKIVYISTASVFDGKKTVPYSEKDMPNPINQYSKTKLEGEKLVNKLKNSLIYRLDYTYGPYGKNLARWIIDSLSKGENINMCNDELFSPTYSINAAMNIILGIEKNLNGVFHIGSSDYMSKYDFAVSLANIFNLNKKLILPVPGYEVWKNRARRPKNTFMDCSKAAGKGLTIRSTEKYLYDLKKRLK